MLLRSRLVIPKPSNLTDQNTHTADAEIDFAKL